jgi:hypothetical protein
VSDIKHLKKAGRLDKHQEQLLDDLQNYIERKFPRSMAGRQLSLDERF